MPNFIEIEETFCGRTYGRTFSPLILLGRLLEVDLKTGTDEIQTRRLLHAKQALYY